METGNGLRLDAKAQPAVLVKYCGGCNAGYDRAAFVERLRAKFPETNFFYYDEAACNPGAFILAVCGCQTQCAARGVSVDAVVYREEDFDSICEAILKTGG